MSQPPDAGLVLSMRDAMTDAARAADAADSVSAGRALRAAWCAAQAYFADDTEACASYRDRLGSIQEDLDTGSYEQSAAEFVDLGAYTPGMRRVAAFTEFLHERLVGEPVRVRINASPNEDRRFLACYCRCRTICTTTCRCWGTSSLTSSGRTTSGRSSSSSTTRSDTTPRATTSQKRTTRRSATSGPSWRGCAWRSLT